MAGIDSIVSTVKELVFYPVMVPHLYQSLGVSPPSGVLLNGPSGCGKTSLALAIAGELGLPFYKVLYIYCTYHLYLLYDRNVLGYRP